MRLRPVTALTLALTLIICCGATNGSCNTSGDTLGPSTGEAIGLTVAAGALVAAVIIIPIEINKSHHTLKGCVFSTPAGLELRTADNKTYALSGTTADIAPGNKLRIRGDHQKHGKNVPGGQVFIVQKMQKNYGPCQALASTQPSPGR